jgi:hypothetical protein
VGISLKGTTSEKVAKMDNIKMHLEEKSSRNVNCSELKQGSDQNHALLSKALNFEVSINGQ